jgi:hypothetical protein
MFHERGERTAVAHAKRKQDPGYHESVTLRCRQTVLNRHSASPHGEFSRRRIDGTEIERVSATYLVADAPARRIRALVVGSVSGPGAAR